MVNDFILENEQAINGQFRNTPLGVKVCPAGKKVYHSHKMNTRIKTYGVGRTNAEELNPVGSIACYVTKGGKGELVPCKVEEYRPKQNKAVISVKNGREVKIVSQDFIRPLSVLLGKNK